MNVEDVKIYEKQKRKTITILLIISILLNGILGYELFNSMINSYKIPNMESLSLKEDDDYCYAIKVVSTDITDDFIYIKDEKDTVYYTYYEPSFIKDLSTYMMVSYSTGYRRNKAIRLSGYKLDNISEKKYMENRR